MRSPRRERRLDGPFPPPPVTFRAIADDPWLIPVALSDGGRKVVWRDVGRCPFTHSLFRWSLDEWDPEHARRPSIETDLSLLARPDFALDTVAPSVFIFHMSRCGSSVLARVLARSPSVLVMSEVPGVNQLLRALFGEGLERRSPDAGRLRILRNFIGALARKRELPSRYFAVKFSSWNALLLPAFRAAFPEVPCLFLHRDPAEVIVSLLHRPAGFVSDQGSVRSRGLTGLDSESLDALDRVDYIAACLQPLMRAASSSPGIDLLAYRDLTKDALPRLLDHLGIACDAREIPEMIEQFDFYAKAFERDVPFGGDTEAKQGAITPEIRRAAARLAEDHAALEASDRNLGAAWHAR